MSEAEPSRTPRVRPARRTAREARAPARARASSRSRTSSTGGWRSPRSATAHEGIEAGEETERHLPRRRPHRAPAAGTARRLSSTSSTAPAGSSSTPARTSSATSAHERLLALDIGDILGIDGTAFESRRGELSLRVDGWQLLAKSLRPPPDKFHGLEDTETRYRHRELDLIANTEAARSSSPAAGRSPRSAAGSTTTGFVEVETPVLQPIYGGALARPFTTHHNALDRDLYLRIATELYLKRLIVGGIERVYELGKDFRNEGISHKHNPEFTMLEWYEAYADYDDAAVRLENLVAGVAEAVLGTTKVKRDGEEIDLAPPWRRVTLRDAIREPSGIDIAEHPTREALAAAMGGEVEPRSGWGKLVDDLLSKQVEPA